MASKGSAFQGDTQQFNSLTISPSGTADFEGAIIHNVGAGVELTDAANVGQVLTFISQGTSTQISTLLGDVANLSTFTYSSITAINSELVTLSGQVSSLNSTVANVGSPSNWAQYAANSTVNIANNNIFSTANQTFTSGANLFTLNYTVLSNVSTAAGSAVAGSPSAWSQYKALQDVNMAASSLKSTIGVTFINTGLTSTLTLDFNTLYTLSTGTTSALASNLSTLSSLVNSNTSNISTLSTTVFQNTSNISTLSTTVFQNTSNISTLSTTVFQNTSNISTLSTTVFQNTSNISTLSTTVFQNTSNISTLSTTVFQNTSNISTLSTTVFQNTSNISTNAVVRRFVGAAEISPSTTLANLIVETNISTLGYLNVFQNTSNTSLKLELKLSTLAVWPNNPFEIMRFAHYGQPGTQSSVILYTEDSSYQAGLLAEMAAGDTISFIYKGGAPLVNNNRISSTQYYRVFGF